MIHVIASILVYDDKLQDVLGIYKDFVPQVLKEKGGSMYLPTIDVQTDLPRQDRNPNVVTVLEQWDDLAAFEAHINQAHSVQFRKDIENIVELISVKVLKAV